MNRRGFLAASAGALVLSKQANGSEAVDEKVVSSEELAKILASFPEKRLTIIYRTQYGVSAENIYECKQNNGDYVSKDIRKANGCKVHQTTEYASEMHSPPKSDTTYDCACTTTSTSKTVHVIDLSNSSIVAITATLINGSSKRTAYVRCENGWAINSSSELIAIGSNSAMFI